MGIYFAIPKKKKNFHKTALFGMPKHHSYIRDLYLYRYERDTSQFAQKPESLVGIHIITLLPYWCDEYICIVYDIIHIWHIPIKNWAIDVVLLLYSWEYCFCCCCWGLSFLWILTWDIISHLPSYENITLHNGDWLIHTPSHWCCTYILYW